MAPILSKEEIIASMRFANCRKWQLDPQENESHYYECPSLEDDPESYDLYWKRGFIEEEWTYEMTDFDKQCYFNIRVSGLRGYWKRDCACADWVVEVFKPFDGGDFPSVFQYLVYNKDDASALSFLDSVKDSKEFCVAVRYGLEAYDYVLKCLSPSTSKETIAFLQREDEIYLFGEQTADRLEDHYKCPSLEERTRLLPTSPTLTFDDLEYLWAFFIGIYPEMAHDQQRLYGLPRTPSGERDDDVMSVSSKSSDCSDSSFDSDCSENTKQLLRNYTKDLKRR